ncbi:MAG: AMP-binding protein [Acidobacteriaceae bacterium]|nr:AMP-binding protein [Acidobacteriaceae bacterium]
MLPLFDVAEIARTPDGIARYQKVPDSLVDMLRRTVERNPVGEAVVTIGGPRLTYRELWDGAARVAGGLRNVGVQNGDRVAIRLLNGHEWALAFYGTLLAGAVVVPVNMRFSEAEVDYVIRDSGALFSFEEGSALPDGEPYAVTHLNKSDLAAIFYTSGTTGFPKGAMTTHECFLSNIETFRRVALLRDSDEYRTLISVPLFHVTGCNSQLLVAASHGGTAVIMQRFDIRQFLQAIAGERITAAISVPAIFWYALNQPDFVAFNTRGVRWVMYGGAPTAPDLVARIIEAFPNARVSNSYGLTESSSIATFLPHEYSLTRPESVGVAAPVVDLDLFEVDAQTGVGELLIRGPNIVAGYWNKPEATAQTFVHGWLHTGDMARLDADGFVQIVDRKKDMVNRGGENVYSVEVENALAAHPAVLESAVVGVPDAMMGEKVGAVIVLKPGCAAEAKAICEFARSRIADFKVPQYVVLREDLLPRNPGGKILKARLRKEVDWGRPLF